MRRGRALGEGRAAGADFIVLDHYRPRFSLPAGSLHYTVQADASGGLRGVEKRAFGSV